MRIAEIFRSIQGEGRLTGTASVFVRVSGCNLRCRFCDTRYASWEPEGENRSVDEIVAQAKQLAEQPMAEAVGHVVVTGGEPLLFAEVVPLCAAFRTAGKHVTIETAGTLYQPVACDLMSISPKLANSTPDAAAGPWAARHAHRRHAADTIRRLTAEYDYQIKFVIDAPPDCDEVETYLREFPEFDRARVMLMPQGVDRDELAAKGRWLEPFCRTHGLQFCPRRQIEWFGLRRGT